jgi:hypothetical protein
MASPNFPLVQLKAGELPITVEIGAAQYSG